MCGIFGYNTINSLGYKSSLKIIDELFLLSESRGKEAAGFAQNNGDAVQYLKVPIPASELISTKAYKSEIEKSFLSSAKSNTVIGHSRLVTNGAEDNENNNQPVKKDNFLLIHNGIVVNSDLLWEEIGSSKRTSDLDSEVILELINEYKNKSGLLAAIKKTMSKIVGMTSIGLMNTCSTDLILATNNGSLYFLASNDKTEFIFASERSILSSLIKNQKINHAFNVDNITQLLPGNILVLNTLLNHYFTENIDSDTNTLLVENLNLKITNISQQIQIKNRYKNKSFIKLQDELPNDFIDFFSKRKLKIDTLRRCTKCILPETFPFIEFDSKGVCNYCTNYSRLVFKGKSELVSELNAFRSSNNQPDCLIPFSGGRDSSYVMHYIKKELGMNPIAFSYDWGMVTDIARRNQARMCGELGVEHILISADIRKKRENIRKNVLAWLKKPHLGTIPLFMAGDKQYFYYSNLLMRQNNLSVSIMGENMLETTRFKTGFCGIPPHFDSEHTYSLKMKDKFKMLSFYGKEFITNPAYINSSLLDTLDSFKSYYMMEHRNINLFDYLVWDEKEVDDTLLNTYGWEVDEETPTTWRIGDGTAAFYNYIYYIVAGFTENDTFRSNQIREGAITREEALKKVELENQPRWKAIQWYCNTIQIDWKETIRKINRISFN